MAGNDTTTQVEFYAPWPDYGRPLNQQWGEIRHDMAALAPLVRGAGLDSDGDFSTLDDVEKTALQAWELGEDGFHNKIRHFWNKDTDTLEIQANVPPGTEQAPHWYTVWAVGDDGQVTQQTTPTTASNVGTGAEVFKQKTGVDLQFRTIKATGVLAVAENSLDLTLTSTAEANTARSDGGTSLVKTKDGVILPFKGITAGENMEFTIGADSITLKSTSQIVEFYGIVVAHSDDSYTARGTHVLKVNVDHFYLTGSGRSNETLLNLRGEIFNSALYVKKSGDSMSGALLHADGSEGAPTVSFSGDTDTGVTRLASDDLALVSGGDAVLRALTDRVYLPKNLQIVADGNAAAPDIFFFPDSDTGLFQPAADQLGFATDGALAGYFDENQNLHVQNDLKSSRVEAGLGLFYSQVYIGDGKVDVPSFAFNNEKGTGVYRSGAAQFSYSIQGTKRLQIASNNIIFGTQIWANTAGLVGAPDYSFDNDATSGMYQRLGSGTDRGNVAFAAGGVQVARIHSGSPFRPEEAYKWQFNYDIIADDGIVVANDLKAGRVEAGIGSFYTALDVDGNATVNFAIFAAENEDVFSQFGGTPAAPTPSDAVDTLVARKERITGTGSRRALLAITEINADLALANPRQNYGANIFVATGENYTVSSDRETVPGALTGNRVSARHKAAGTIAMAGGVSSEAEITGGNEEGVITLGYAYLDEGGDGGIETGEITEYRGLWVKASTGNVLAKFGIYIDSLINGGNTTAILIEDQPNGPAISFFSDIVGPDNGLNWGLTADTNLYRSATSTLKTDGAFVVSEDAYSGSWDSNSSVPTKNAVYDKIQSIEQFYAVTFRESEAGGAVYQTDTFTVDSAAFYLSTGGDGKPLLSPKGNIIRTDTHQGIANLLHLNDGGLSDDEALGMTVASDGATITLTITNAGANKAATAPLEIQFEGQNYTYTPSGGAETLTLTAGTATVPKENFVVFELIGGVPTLVTSTTDWPSGAPGAQHARLCTVVVQDVTSVQTHGALKIHAWTDHIEEIQGAGSGERGERGHLHSIAERLRNEPAVWRSGSAITVDNSGTTDPLYVHIAKGTGYQMHRHSSPALDTDGSDLIFVVNDDTTPYTTIDQLNALENYATDGEGSIGNSAKFTVVLWMVVNENSGDTKLFLNLPTGGYNTVNAAKTDSDSKAVHGIPQAYVGTSILLYELVLGRSGGGNTWTVEDTVDLRGVPGVAVGGGGAATTGEVNAAANIGAGIGVFAQKTNEVLEFKSFMSKGASIALASDATSVTIDATGSFYMPVTVEGADAKLTVGSGEVGNDSVTSYHRDGDLVWTVGVDHSANEFVITSGAMGSEHNEINLAVDKVGFFNAVPVSKPSITVGDAAEILAALVSLGLVSDDIP
jgi:hypothetical protein